MAGQSRCDKCGQFRKPLDLVEISETEVTGYKAMVNCCEDCATVSTFRCGLCEQLLENRDGDDHECHEFLITDDDIDRDMDFESDYDAYLSTLPEQRDPVGLIDHTGDEMHIIKPPGSGFTISALEDEVEGYDY